MRPILVLACAAACGFAVLPSCGREAPPAPVMVTPATGWTEADTAAVTTELGAAVAAHGWVGQFKEVNGRSPVVEITTPTDRSDDRVPVAAVAEAFARVLGGSDRVLVAGEGQVSDASLTTVIGLRKTGSQAWFTIDCRVVDGKTGDLLWPGGGLERVRNEPVPVPAPAPAPR